MNIKIEITYELELCACRSYINVRKRWFDSKGPHNVLIGTFPSVRICIDKAKTDFNYHFNRTNYKFATSCNCWKYIPVQMKDTHKEEITYAD